jgi:hypothetical protein
MGLGLRPPSKLLKNSFSLGGGGFGPRVDDAKPTGFRGFCVRCILAEAPEESLFSVFQQTVMVEN